MHRVRQHVGAFRSERQNVWLLHYPRAEYRTGFYKIPNISEASGLCDSQPQGPGFPLGDEPFTAVCAGTNPASNSRMGLGIAGEAFLEPEVVLPIQFQGIWRDSAATTPEGTLAVSVLCQAADDLLKYRYARRRGRQRLYMEAYTWVASNDRCWPYSFLNLCEALRLSPNAVRAVLLRAALPDRSSHFRGAAGRTPRVLRVGPCLRSLPSKRCSKTPV